jgi:hypothetical protein
MARIPARPQNSGSDKSRSRCPPQLSSSDARIWRWNASAVAMSSSAATMTVTTPTVSRVPRKLMRRLASPTRLSSRRTCADAFSLCWRRRGLRICHQAAAALADLDALRGAGEFRVGVRRCHRSDGLAAAEPGLSTICGWERRGRIRSSRSWHTGDGDGFGLLLQIKYRPVGQWPRQICNRGPVDALQCAFFTVGVPLLQNDDNDGFG